MIVLHTIFFHPTDLFFFLGRTMCMRPWLTLIEINPSYIYDINLSHIHVHYHLVIHKTIWQTTNVTPRINRLKVKHG